MHQVGPGIAQSDAQSCFQFFLFIVINSIIVFKFKFETGSTPASLTKLAFARDQVYIATSN